MSSEIMICFLCLVSFFLMCWAMLLRTYIKELEKKVAYLEKYYKVTAKLKDV